MQRNEEAEAAYAAAWQQWCMASDEDKKCKFEQVMDGLQPEIATSPKDPRWSAFIDTLPEYRQLWNGWHDDMIKNADKLRDAS